jgi:hypothetical protein
VSRDAGLAEALRRPSRHDWALMSLDRIAWLTTVMIAVIVAVILLIEGYFGYAATTFAVALAAAINLL